MPKTRSKKPSKPRIDAEFQSRRKTLPAVMNLQMLVGEIEYVGTGAAILHLTVATVNGDRPGEYPTEFRASVVLDRTRLRELFVNRQIAPDDQQQQAALVASQLVLDRARTLALAAQEATVVAQSSALAVGAAARRVFEALGGDTPQHFGVQKR